MERVQQALKAKGLSCKVQKLADSTRTAEEAAQTLQCEVRQIAKSLVFKDTFTGNPVLIIASGNNQVDLKKIKAAKGITLIKPEGSFVKERVGFAIGGIPPLGHKEKIQTFLDPTLLDREWLWAAAGTPFSVFQFASADLQKMTDGEFIDLKVD